MVVQGAAHCARKRPHESLNKYREIQAVGEELEEEGEMDGNSILALSDLLNPPKEESDDVSVPA